MPSSLSSHDIQKKLMMREWAVPVVPVVPAVPSASLWLVAPHLDLDPSTLALILTSASLHKDSWVAQLRVRNASKVDPVAEDPEAAQVERGAGKRLSRLRHHLQAWKSWTG